MRAARQWLGTLSVVALAAGCAMSVGSDDATSPGSSTQESVAAPANTVTPAPPPAPIEAAPGPARVGAPAASREPKFSVQVSSITNERAAREAAQGLADRGFPSYVLTAPGTSGTSYYQVRVGPFGDRDSADAIATTLKGLGYSTWLVTE